MTTEHELGVWHHVDVGVVSDTVTSEEKPVADGASFREAIGALGAEQSAAATAARSPAAKTRFSVQRIDVIADAHASSAEVAA